MNSIVRFLKNKNTVTVIGILFIVGILWGGYYYQLQKQVKPVQVPVAAVTIQPRTKITADMITYVDVPQSYIADTAVTEQANILDKYTNYNTVIPAGSMFYNETLTTEKALPNYLLTRLKDGEYLTSFKFTSTDNAWGIMPGDKIDIYMRVTSDEGSIMLGKFVENVEVLDVVDSQGQSVYEVSDGSRTPDRFIFAMQEDLFLLFLRSQYIDVEFFPIQHGAWIDDTKTSLKMSTQELIDYITARVTSLSSDPKNGIVQRVQ